MAAIFGVISPSGGEIGPFRAVEESILAGLVDKQQRPALFGSFIVTGALAASLSTWLGGLFNKLVDAQNGEALMAYYRCVFVVYAVMGLIKLLLSLSLSSRCEAPLALLFRHHLHQRPTNATLFSRNQARSTRL